MKVCRTLLACFCCHRSAAYVGETDVTIKRASVQRIFIALIMSMWWEHGRSPDGLIVEADHRKLAKRSAFVVFTRVIHGHSATERRLEYRVGSGFLWRKKPIKPWNCPCLSSNLAHLDVNIFPFIHMMLNVGTRLSEVIPAKRGV